MESLDRSKAIIELGKKIVVGLQLGEDVVAQWMAHVVAEKIAAAEAAGTQSNDKAVIACMEVIMLLWSNRYALPPHVRPFKELDPLLRTLESLRIDEKSGFRYLPRAPRDEEMEGTTQEEKEWLEFAIGIDHSARELIRYALMAASERSMQVVTPWLSGAVHGGLDANVELLLSKFVADGDRTIATDEAHQQATLQRIEKLEAFGELALRLVGELKKTLPPDVQVDSAE